MSKYKKVVSLGLSNHYGEVFAYETLEGGFYIELGDVTGLDYKAISEEFFRAIEKEFTV